MLRSLIIAIAVCLLGASTSLAEPARGGLLAQATPAAPAARVQGVPRACVLDLERCTSWCASRGGKNCAGFCAGRNCTSYGKQAKQPQPTGRQTVAAPTTPPNARAALSPAIPFMQRGRAHLRDGKQREAIAEFDAAEKADPRWAPAYAARCAARSQLGAYRVAITDCDQALKIDPRNAEALVNRGNDYLMLGNLKQGLVDLEAAVEANPAHPGPYAFRAMAYLSMGNQERALEDLATALSIDPKYPYAHAHLGLVHNRQKQYDKAVESFSEFLRTTPRSFQHLSHRGIAYVNLGDRDRALADFDAALAINPKDATALGYRGRVRVEMGESGAAIDDLTAALQISPNIPASLIWRARAYEAGGIFDKAQDDFQAVLRLNPSHAVARAGVERVEAKLAKAAGAAAPVRRPGSRVALVIGNSRYATWDTLRNAERDAHLISKAFTELGFVSVNVVHDGSREKLLTALKSFASEAATADWAVVYYAGHGIEFQGSNYLVPVDVKYEIDENIPNESVALDHVLNAVAGADKLRLVVLDACRENPFISGMESKDPSSVGKGLPASSLRLGRW
jgi:tetratricopeptide (TPR) repeat protein